MSLANESKPDSLKNQDVDLLRTAIGCVLLLPHSSKFIIADCRIIVKFFMQFSHKIVKGEKKRLPSKYEIIQVAKMIALKNTFFFSQNML